MTEILNLKLAILQDYQDIIQMVTIQVGLKTFLLLQKLKILFRGHILLMILKVKKLLKRFMKKNCKKKKNQKQFRVEKVIPRKGDKLYVTWKGNNSSFNSWTDKKTV